MNRLDVAVVVASLTAAAALAFFAPTEPVFAYVAVASGAVAWVALTLDRARPDMPRAPKRSAVVVAVLPVMMVILGSWYALVALPGVAAAGGAPVAMREDAIASGTTPMLVWSVTGAIAAVAVLITASTARVKSTTVSQLGLAVTVLLGGWYLVAASPMRELVSSVAWSASHAYPTTGAVLETLTVGAWAWLVALTALSIRVWLESRVSRRTLAS